MNTVAAKVNTNKMVDGFVSRLAYEAVPVRAIARSLGISYSDVNEIIVDGLEKGTLVERPRDDWDPGASHSARNEHAVMIDSMDSRLLIMPCIHLFGLTRLQSALFLHMIRRRECTKDSLHAVIEARRQPNPRETSPKMVDVVICLLRKRLEPLGFHVKTIWACGYMLPQAERERATAMLASYVRNVDTASLPVPNPKVS